MCHGFGQDALRLGCRPKRILSIAQQARTAARLEEAENAEEEGVIFDT